MVQSLYPICSSPNRAQPGMVSRVAGLSAFNERVACSLLWKQSTRLHLCLTCGCYARDRNQSRSATCNPGIAGAHVSRGRTWAVGTSQLEVREHLGREPIQARICPTARTTVRAFARQLSQSNRLKRRVENGSRYDNASAVADVDFTEALGV